MVLSVNIKRFPAWLCDARSAARVVPEGVYWEERRRGAETNSPRHWLGRPPSWLGRPPFTVGAAPVVVGAAPGVAEPSPGGPRRKAAPRDGPGYAPNCLKWWSMCR